MKEKGGVLEVHLDEPVISESDLGVHPHLKAGRHLQVTVKDTGPGISKKNIERIFEPYFTTKEKGEGTGLGLAVVRGIIDDHQGDIKVYSADGNGATFRIWLPLVQQKLEADLAETAESLPTGTEAVLFIDDEKTLVEIGTLSLEELGYTVTGTTSPHDAIELFKESKDEYDLVITDKTMPHLTGFDLVQALR